MSKAKKDTIEVLRNKYTGDITGYARPMTHAEKTRFAPKLEPIKGLCPEMAMRKIAALKKLVASGDLTDADFRRIKGSIVERVKAYGRQA